MSTIVRRVGNLFALAPAAWSAAVCGAAADGRAETPARRDRRNYKI